MATTRPHTPVFLPEKPHRQRKLVGYSPWGGPQESTWRKWLSTLNTSVKDFFSSYIEKNQEWTVNGFLVVYGLKSNFPLLFYTLLNVNLETTHCHPMAWLRMFLFNSGSCSYLEAGHTFPSLSFQYTDESSESHHLTGSEKNKLQTCLIFLACSLWLFVSHKRTSEILFSCDCGEHSWVRIIFYVFSSQASDV